MSRKYTNRKGEQIKVSQEHLDVSVELIKELQKNSPSRRCSWTLHKKMMVEEGFEDSDSSEGYRQMMKAERKSRGALPPIERVMEANFDNKLQSIKDEIGNINSAKLGARDEFNRLSRMKREWTRELIITESIERAIENISINIPTPRDVKSLDKNKTLLVGLSDWHYGALVDIEGHKYDKDICRDLVFLYADKIIDIVDKENVTEIYAIGMGDIIENIYMRNTQSFTAEMTFSEQVAGVSELIIEFLETLAQYVPVKYAGFNGNHDRLSTKNDTIYGDGAVHLSNQVVKTYVKATKNKRIEFIESEPYHHIVNVHDKSFLFEHGDLTPMKKQSVLSDRQVLHGQEFDALICGHIHHFTNREVGDNKFVTTFGSIKGSDEYSLKQIGVSSSRSQGVVIVDDEDFEIRRVAI
ncbi:metallophosphatase family protein [Vagococcus fluvialis]|uniref:metallophosphatase family protein n=1 Tax=Vagococcus fluvialis TaxID=2738 RepID=UPI001D0AC689|nr:metallophosphatase family protein [Vagococcus fluvialis]UDM72667.1 metallophosphatase family protein [Vagococcus fluvialis]UDM78390.1 metallophosphatase family protein [Vagococcus fluvialis]UDM83942.1 metallophosphatase family protein [Vagococcus fluvialis]